MNEVKILDRDEPLLREIAKPVTKSEIGSKKIKDILERMKFAMHREDDGVAIAAPQIGEGLRIFMVRGEALALSDKKKVDPDKELQDLIFINPEIIKASKKKRKMEEGCLSVRWLYGFVERSEKITIKALDENGKEVERGASGLLAQIFQHEIDHLDGILFIDKAKNLRDIPPRKKLKIVFFGSSQFSQYVLDELENNGFSPLVLITSTKAPLPIKELKELEPDVFIVASFGKILPQELIDMPKFKTLNVHPSLLPELRGPAPIQGSILGLGTPGVSIMRLDEKMDHGPIVAQEKVEIEPWPDHYKTVEEKLGKRGGQLLAEILEDWADGKIEEQPQDDSKATYIKLIKKEDGLIDLNDSADKNLRKILAYSTWPGAYMFYKNKLGKEIRIVVKDAEIKEDKLILKKVIPAGKKEMTWDAFLRGN